MPLSWSHSNSHFNDLFSFSQPRNKIFYHLLGRLGVFFFISSLSGSIKLPLTPSFYNSRIGILFFSFFMWRLFFFPPSLKISPPVSPACCCCMWWGGGRGIGKGGTQGHVFAVIHALQGKVLNKKKYFSTLFSTMRTSEPLVVKKWLCWFKRKILLKFALRLLSQDLQ